MIMRPESPIAVLERVQGLEFGMNDRQLDERVELDVAGDAIRPAVHS